MKVQLFGVGVEGQSRAITAQRRVNCYVEKRVDNDKTSYALIGRPGLRAFVSTLGNNPTRGSWAVNTLTTPLLFVVQSSSLIAINNAGVGTTIGNINTSSGDVSMVDNGTYLMLVDGTQGWYYNMVSGGALTLITDGNFTTSPKTVTWQDTYFIVTSGATNQWQLSNNADPTTWPAVNINFTGAAPGALQAGMADHGVMNLFGEVYSEFWQDTGSPDFPYAVIPGSAQEFGLAAAFSLAKFDNSLVGLFKNKMGGVNVSRLQGFNLHRLSTADVETLLFPVTSIATATGYAFMVNGHPFYVVNMPDADLTLMYDGASGIWSELQSYGHTHFLGSKFANFLNRLTVSDHHSGDIWQFDTAAYDDVGDPLVMMVQSRHIWDDDKTIGISRVQIDCEQGVGLISGQGEFPALDLQVSKDGGNSYYSVGYSSIGPLGEYTQRTTWNSLGGGRDMVLRLIISDPVKRVITGASAEITIGSY